MNVLVIEVVVCDVCSKLLSIEKLDVGFCFLDI